MTLPASSSRIALVLGITGGLGRALAVALHGRGYIIRALSRDPAKATASARLPFAVDWRQGDALDRGAVLRAAAGTAIIAHAVNPPGYAKWREKAVPMLTNSIVAAQHSGARILFPGNIYAFGPMPVRSSRRTARRTPTRSRAPFGWTWRRCCGTPPAMASAR